jgi:alkylation response protein AidB-like acyl-CoA dehydrogenase
LVFASTDFGALDPRRKVLGGAGVTSDYGLAYAYAIARVLRLADGRDEVQPDRPTRTAQIPGPGVPHRPLG